MTIESGILVIHCADPRYQGAFHDFLRRDLGLERYALVAVPGGPQFLSADGYLPKFAWTGWRWMKFLGKLSPVSRVILIAHDDCRWYHEMGLFQGADPKQKQVADLREVAAACRARFESAKVECWFARLEGGRAAFESV